MKRLKILQNEFQRFYSKEIKYPSENKIEIKYLMVRSNDLKLGNVIISEFNDKKEAMEKAKLLNLKAGKEIFVIIEKTK
jgi:hypothetical protein